MNKASLVISLHQHHDSSYVTLKDPRAVIGEIFAGDQLIANRAGEPRDYRATLAGRCCESGDLLGENMEIQKAKRGDILAVLVTGAYNFAMASNYNRLPRPPVILVKDGAARVAVRRETYEDLVRNDVL